MAINKEKEEFKELFFADMQFLLEIAEGKNPIQNWNQTVTDAWRRVQMHIDSLLAAQREEIARQIEKELTPGDGQYDNGYEDAINKSLSIIRTPLSDTK